MTQVTIVYVNVKPQHVDDFIEECRINHEASVQEQGNFRFDVLQMADEPTRFVLYEAYNSGQEAAKHKETQHYLNWRDTVSDWMAEPRQGIPYGILFPTQS